jgi:hypothetical protein
MENNLSGDRGYIAGPNHQQSILGFGREVEQNCPAILNRGTGGGQFVTSIDQKKLPRAIGFFQLKLYSLDELGSGNIPFREIEELVAGEISFQRANLMWRQTTTHLDGGGT